MSDHIEIKSTKDGEVFETYNVYLDVEGRGVAINLKRKKGLTRKMSTDPDFIPLDFSPDEAEQLATALLKTVAEARQWNKELDEYFEQERLRQGTNEVADGIRIDFETGGG